MNQLSAHAQQFRTKLLDLDASKMPDFNQALGELKQLARQLTTADRTALAHDAKIASADLDGAAADTFSEATAVRLGKDSGAPHSYAGETTGCDKGHIKIPIGEERGRGSR